MKIASYINKKCVLFLDSDTRDEVLKALVHSLESAAVLKNGSTFYQAILDREKIISTGIGMGVAIPHAKLPHYERFFIAMAVLKKSIDWGALDHIPVRLVFMIGGPDDRPTEYLKILSQLTSFLKNEELRRKILTINSPEDMMELIKTY